MSSSPSNICGPSHLGLIQSFLRVFSIDSFMSNSILLFTLPSVTPLSPPPSNDPLLLSFSSGKGEGVFFIRSVTLLSFVSENFLNFISLDKHLVSCFPFNYVRDTSLKSWVIGESIMSYVHQDIQVRSKILGSPWVVQYFIPHRTIPNTKNSKDSRISVPLESLTTAKFKGYRNSSTIL